MINELASSSHVPQFFLFISTTTGFRAQALAVTTDTEHKFDLALNLGELKIAHELAVEAEVRQSLAVQFHLEVLVPSFESALNDIARPIFIGCYIAESKTHSNRFDF